MPSGMIKVPASGFEQELSLGEYVMKPIKSTPAGKDDVANSRGIESEQPKLPNDDVFEIPPQTLAATEAADNICEHVATLDSFFNKAETVLMFLQFALEETIEVIYSQLTAVKVKRRAMDFIQ